MEPSKTTTLSFPQNFLNQFQANLKTQFPDVDEALSRAGDILKQGFSSEEQDFLLKLSPEKALYVLKFLDSFYNQITYDLNTSNIVPMRYRKYCMAVTCLTEETFNRILDCKTGGNFFSLNKLFRSSSKDDELQSFVRILLSENEKNNHLQLVVEEFNLLFDLESRSRFIKLVYAVIPNENFYTELFNKLHSGKNPLVLVLFEECLKSFESRKSFMSAVWKSFQKLTDKELFVANLLKIGSDSVRNDLLKISFKLENGLNFYVGVFSRLGSGKDHDNILGSSSASSFSSFEGLRENFVVEVCKYPWNLGCMSKRPSDNELLGRTYYLIIPEESEKEMFILYKDPKTKSVISVPISQIENLGKLIDLGKFPTTTVTKISTDNDLQGELLTCIEGHTHQYLNDVPEVANFITNIWSQLTLEEKQELPFTIYKNLNASNKRSLFVGSIWPKLVEDEKVISVSGSSHSSSSSSFWSTSTTNAIDTKEKFLVDCFRFDSQAFVTQVWQALPQQDHRSLGLSVCKYFCNHFFGGNNYYFDQPSWLSKFLTSIWSTLSLSSDGAIEYALKIVQMITLKSNFSIKDIMCIVDNVFSVPRSVDFCTELFTKLVKAMSSSGAWQSNEFAVFARIYSKLPDAEGQQFLKGFWLAKSKEDRIWLIRVVLSGNSGINSDKFISTIWPLSNADMAKFVAGVLVGGHIYGGAGAGENSMEYYFMQNIWPVFSKYVTGLENQAKFVADICRSFLSMPLDEGLFLQKTRIICDCCAQFLLENRLKVFNIVYKGLKQSSSSSSSSTSCYYGVLEFTKAFWFVTVPYSPRIKGNWSDQYQERHVVERTQDIVAGFRAANGKDEREALMKDVGEQLKLLHSHFGNIILDLKGKLIEEVQQVLKAEAADMAEEFSQLAMDNWSCITEKKQNSFDCSLS